MKRRVVILGSTGSIGTQALEVVTHLNQLHSRGACPVGFEVVGLAAGNNARLLMEQAERFGVRDLALAAAAETSSSRFRAGAGAAERLVREVDCDVVLAAMVGSAGLPATLAAVELGRDVALANKETLVAAGGLVVPAAAKSGARLLPVDSEHSGVWQALRPNQQRGSAAKQQTGTSEDGGVPPFRCGPEVKRVILTASGGPFRTWAKERIESATPAEALRHPTWTMGAKVTVDSASLMNKALELVEAHWLFGLESSRLGAVVHPQSIVHAIVEFEGGGVLAHLAPPDMRVPIQHALAHPFLVEPMCGGGLGRTLEFEEPDLDRFPALAMGARVIDLGGSSGATLNAANEEAVQAFLRQTASRPVPFGAVVRTVRRCMDETARSEIHSLEDVRRAEEAARAFVRSRLADG